MKIIKVKSTGSYSSMTEIDPYVNTILNTIEAPLILLDNKLDVIEGNTYFYKRFHLDKSETDGRSFFDLPFLEIDKLHAALKNLKDHKKSFSKFEGALELQVPGRCTFSLNGSWLEFANQDTGVILLSFQDTTAQSHIQSIEERSRKSFREVLSHAPAAIATARGKDHVFEIANERYLQLVGHREVIGKKVKDVLPEIESQGFINILDEVYRTGEPFIGNEVPITLTNHGKPVNRYVDFVYHPTRNSEGEVDGIFVHAIDVTEQVRVRKKVEESEDELRQLIDTVPAIIWITNENGESVYLNKNWCKYTGQKLKEAKKFGWLEMVHPQDRQKAGESFLHSNKNKQPYNFTFRLRTAAGAYRWVLNTGMPKFNGAGEYEGMMGTVVDVHDEKVKEILIKESEHRYEELIFSSPSLIATFKGEDHIVEIANDAIIKAWGKGPNVIGKPLLEILPELKEQGIDKILFDVYTTGEPFRAYEMPLELERGGKRETFYFNFIYYPQRDAEGNIIGIVDIATEVTTQALLNKTIRDSEYNFRQMAECMPDMIINTDADGKYIYFNQNCIDYTGMELNELRVKGWDEIIHPQDKEIFRKQWQKSLSKGLNFEMEVRCRNQQGKYKWHLCRANAVRDENNRIKMWIGVNTEIQKMKEEEKRKEDFLKMVSHELKTPITSIKGYVQLLLTMLNKDGNIEPKLSSIPLKPSLERIDHQIARLTRLIAEMLDLTRIEENRLELHKEIFDLNALVTQTVQDITFTNAQHKIEILHDHRCSIFADKDRIGQVIINLITNAIKYSPESQAIKVRIHNAGNGKIAISVKDNGIGIDKKNHKKIFKRFYRIGGKNEETFSGFGIGLYLANEIMQRHNGFITVDSKKDEGSTFTITLSCASGDNTINNLKNE